MRSLRNARTRLRILARPFVVRRYLRSHERRMLELGGGERRPGWLGADAFDRGADIYLNAARALPFADETWDVVYSEHMLEHIDVDRVPGLLAEVKRVLRTGGLLRLTVPDLEIHARNYVAGNDEFFAPILEEYAQRRARRPDKYWLVRSNGGAFMTRAAQRFYGHRWMYDFETLGACLRDAGFASCTRRAFGQGRDPRVAALDRRERAFETLYVEAVK